MEDKNIGTPEVEFRQKRKSTTDKPKETKHGENRVENYKSIFGETTDVKNASYINDLLASKTKQREDAKLQEEERQKREKNKQNRRAASQTPTTESSKQPALLNISTKTPEKLVSMDIQKVQQSPGEESMENNQSVVFAKAQPQNENPDSVVLSQVGTVNSIETGKPELQHMESIMTGSFVRAEDPNTQPCANHQVSMFSSLVKPSQPEEADHQPLSMNHKRKSNQPLENEKAKIKAEMGNESMPDPEFVSAINDYIGYFEKPLPKEVPNDADILVHNTPREQDSLLLQQEIKSLLHQNKKLHAQVGACQKKVHDLQIMNQIITNELIESRNFINKLQEVII